MKIKLRYRLGVTLFTTLLMASVVVADVFRSVDANGNVTYSDKPHDGAKKVEVLQPTIVPAHRSTTKLGPKKSEQAALPYTTIRIISPANEETLRNIQSVSVSGQLTPGLQRRFGHKVSFLFDGKPIGKPGDRLNVSLAQLERGAHTLRLVVLDNDGKIVAQSSDSKFFVHKISVQGQSRGQGGS